MSAIPAGLVIRFKRWEGNADLPVPAYASSGAAGFDLRAAAPEGETLVLKPGARAMVPTGFSVAIPDGYEMQVRPRSGLAFKNGVTVVNAPGTVDSDYRGQVCVLLINLGEEDFAIRRGDRIAQGIIAAAPQWPLVEVDDLDATERGAGGFGSTGV
ncbi:dUTP diphosphatase [Caulobacter sp. SSI4214]|jgi:dUTP pyrophosphatase|uniref:dUTP diphosphatase n=1 Tax=Caulobacter sp. SSI4214 TaxID=2575739 RepID=UPI00143A4DF6|nr:dUTP diphosphatase [Caulobacter sp. SSI4214]